MKEITKKLTMILLLAGFCQEASADFGKSDSASYSLNLMTPPISGMSAPADSLSYSLVLSPVNRHWAESSTFFLDILDIIGDINNDNKVNEDDLLLLVQQWLQEPGTPSADIAPEPLDDFVNINDFALVAEHWLEGVE